MLSGKPKENYSVHVATLKPLSLDNFWFPADRVSFLSLQGKKEKSHKDYF